MKIDGVEIERLKTGFLVRKRTESLVLAAIMGFFAVMSVFLTIITLVELSRPPESYMDDNSFFSMMLVFSLCGSVFFGFSLKPSIKQIVAINKELATRSDYQKEKQTESSNIRWYVVAAAIFVGIVLLISAVGEGCSSSGSSGRKWSDLSDVEKDNARWAYYAQQAIDDR